MPIPTDERPIFLVATPVNFQKGTDNLIRACNSLGMDLDTNMVVFVSADRHVAKLLWADNRINMSLECRLKNPKSCFQRIKVPTERHSSVIRITEGELYRYLHGLSIQDYVNRLYL